MDFFKFLSSRKRFYIYKSLLFLNLLVVFNANFSVAESEIYLNNKNSTKEDNVNLNTSSYILGPGDLLNIQFYDAKEYSTNLEVLNDGFVSVPFIGNVEVSNLTIDQAKKNIQSMLSSELLRPDIVLTLLNARPIKVSLVGEVNRPGLYRFSRDVLNSSFGIKSVNQTSIKSNVGLPTVYDAIQKAGGMRKEANFKNVILTRKLPSKNNEFKSTSLNLIDLILNGNQIQNPYLFDGDIIEVKKAKYSNVIDKKLFTSNLSPETITVHIIGEVVNPGKIEISNNTPLYQAVMQAGGPIDWKAKKNKFQLLRVKTNGSIERKNFTIKLNKRLAATNNPLLENGDIVKVKSTTFGKASKGIKIVTEPLSGIISAVSLYKLLD